jgi:hypothetical protein
MTPEEKRINDRFERIEATLDRVASEGEIWFEQFKTNLELLQDFMSGAFKRSEARLEQIEQRLNRTAELLERHVSDGHGSEEEEEES